MTAWRGGHAKASFRRHVGIAAHMIGRAGLAATFACVATSLLACALPDRAASQELCPPPAAMPTPRLPHARLALATNQPILIVALGSSSTRGWMATDIGHSYPSWLQRVLNDALPKADISVINRGIGGQDAPEELARLYQDVLALRPQIAIWQAGANGAIRDASPAAFKILMQEGIGELKAAGVDVILMDNQRAPKILASSEHAQMDQALREVAATTGENLFSRGGLMDQWAATGATLDDFIAPDGLHMNNRGYYCLAQSLGSAIATALRQPLAAQTAGAK
jgi:lysophospholipase L1-like esterase